jgi:hypothetical protein
MFTLAVYATITTGLLAWLAVRWARDRWVKAGDQADALADLSKPDPADGLMAVADATREPARRGWHTHPCGCWCGTDGRTRVCPTHALEVQEIRDLLAWERERHQP